MLVVVEGVDASGKSTLLENSREIRGRYFVLLRHSCRPLRPSDVSQLMTLVAGAWGLDIVLDRHPLISEPIYGPILRGYDLASTLMTKEQIDRRLVKTVDKIIYCRPPADKILHNLDNRPQLAGIRERFDDLLTAYDIRMYELSLIMKVVTYDYTVPVDFESLLFKP